MKTYVIYHNNCWDGFGAAWVAWLKFGDDATYIPANYGTPPPEMILGSKVYIVDFSYSRVQLEPLAKIYDLQVIDHHKTAQAELAGLPFCLFDMTKSGAMLTWEHFNPDRQAPKLIRYVQDRDLWQWKLGGSRAISAWLQSHPLHFEQWNDLANKLQFHFNIAEQEGDAILRAKRLQVEAMCKYARTLTIAGHSVPVVNATTEFSEVGEHLCELYPDAPFSAYYFDRNDGQRQWGLRTKKQFDVSAIAKKFGGGGHAAAAGFQTSQDFTMIG